MTVAVTPTPAPMRASEAVRERYFEQADQAEIRNAARRYVIETAIGVEVLLFVAASLLLLLVKHAGGD